MPDGPFITIAGVERIVLPKVTPLGAKSRIEVLRSFLNRALEMGLADHFLNGSPPPEGEVVMAYFRRLVAESPLFIDTPVLPLGRKGYSEMVRIETVGKGPHGIPREFNEDDWGILDPSSTSQSNNINQVYRKADGNPWSLSDVLYRNAIGLKYLSSRTFLLRTTFESHIEQIVSEPPLIGNVRNELSGKNLLTAFMDLGIKTFEDSLAVSESAAAAMTSKMALRKTFVTRNLVCFHVNEGDTVINDEVLATLLPNDTKIRARKIPGPGKIMKISSSLTSLFGYPALRYEILMECELPLRTGDKISGRHGNKGIAWVVSDDEMPMVTSFLDPTKTVRADICISPLSIVKRRMMSIFWEAMATRKAMCENTRFEVGPWEVPDHLAFSQLLSEGHGKKVPVWIDECRLEYPVFVAPVYWLRLDKLGVQGQSAAGASTHLNHLNLPLDSTVNGQRRDMSKSVAMSDRGLTQMLASVCLRNTMDVKYMEGLVRTLEPEFQLQALAGGEAYSREE